MPCLEDWQGKSSLLESTEIFGWVKDYKIVASVGLWAGPTDY